MSEVKKTQKKSWFAGLKSEFKKIIWPDKVTLVRESTAVIVVALLLGVIISVVDLFIKYGIEFIIG